MMDSTSGDAKESGKASNTCNFRFIENHYFSLPSQGNVYSLVPLKTVTGNTRILVSSLQRKMTKTQILCIEYLEGKYVVHEGLLASIPNGADVVSMNAFNKEDKYEVGLTVILKDGAGEQALLNLYSDWDVGMPSNQEVTNCSSIQLNYLPYVLYYTRLPSISGTEMVWLLSGSDRTIHLFSYCKDTGRYQGNPSKGQLFPEFDQVHGITLNLDVWYSPDMKSRKTATSGESGNVHMFDVDLSDPSTPVISSSREIKFDFPASSVKIFSRRNKRPDLTSLDVGIRKRIEDITFRKDDDGQLLTLVTMALESCFVYGSEPVNRTGFLLPDSDNYDVVTCSLVCDVDFDGINEIVLGTYGQMILIYKEKGERTNEWDLMEVHPLPSPVLALAYEDVLGDGAKELIVSTMAGVHVLQVDPAFSSAVILRRLRMLKLSTND